jgi:hypothetical protein
MTPAEVYELDDDEYRSFASYMREEIKARERAAKRKS